MSTPSETHDTLAARPSAEARTGAAAGPRAAARERHPFPTLPAGWAVIGRCRFGTGKPGPHATGCYALAHPENGVALLDIAPNATPNAEARLRRALTAAEFWPDFPGTLPVMHDRVDATALWSLPWVLEKGFAALPALTVPGGAAWIEGVRRAMAADSAWELPGQPKAAPDAPPPAPADDVDAVSAPRARPGSPRRWKRLATLPLAFAATFAVGLVSGFLLLDTQAPVAPTSTQAMTATAPPQQPTAAPQPAEAMAVSATTPTAPAMSAGAPRPAAAVDTAPTAAAPPVAPAPTAAAYQPPTPDAEAPPPVGTPVVQQAAPSVGSNAAPPVAPALETQVSNVTPVASALPLAPPRAPAPPVRANSPQQASRPAPVIDRACSQALYRFQLGERLTVAEQNFIRTGCSTTRR